MKLKLKINKENSESRQKPVLTVVATAWHEPIYITDGPRKWRLRNWHEINRGRLDNDEFTWGYRGYGCVCTSYSILNELFSKETADDYADFMLDLIESLDQNKGWKLTSKQLSDEVQRLAMLGRSHSMIQNGGMYR